VGSAYGRLPLNALRVFEAVASRLSFAEAAEALSVTPAAVSQQIRSLEDYLQIPLLRRSGRKVELTPEGAALLPGIRQGLDTLLASLHQLQQMRAKGNLSVSTLASLLQKWITPRLHRLHSANPELQVDWHTSRAAVDFTRSDFHAAIRFGGGHYPGLHSERLMDEWLVAVAAPAVLARYGPLDPDKGLEGRPILLAKDETWAQWRGEQTDEDWPAGSATIDDSVSILVAAAEGLGFAVVRWSLAAPDIERGLISIASPHVFVYHWAYWLVCPEAYTVLPKFQAFRDWLRAEADAFKGPAMPLAPPSRPGKPKRSRKKKAGSG
jgi:LysR family glycine cleavage system transcriptional activator